MIPKFTILFVYLIATGPVVVFANKSDWLLSFYVIVTALVALVTLMTIDTHKRGL